MLIFIKIFGGGLSGTHALELANTDTILDLKKKIVALHPGILIKRLLVGGRQLSNESATIEESQVQKESTIQCFAGKDDGSGVQAPVPADSDELPPVQDGPPGLLRQNTLQAVSYGDIFVVRLIEARNLVPMDEYDDFQSSDPYAILALGSQQARSAVIEKSLDPRWDELFGFYVSPEESDSNLSVICWDQDFGKADDPEGFVDIKVSSIPRGETVDRYYKLQDVAHGEVHLSIKRAALSSPQLRDVLLKVRCSLGH